MKREAGMVLLTRRISFLVERFQWRSGIHWLRPRFKIVYCKEYVIERGAKMLLTKLTFDVIAPNHDKKIDTCKDFCALVEEDLFLFDHLLGFLKYVGLDS